MQTNIPAVDESENGRPPPQFSVSYVLLLREKDKSRVRLAICDSSVALKEVFGADWGN
jgi:hypothetical protein